MSFDFALLVDYVPALAQGAFVTAKVCLISFMIIPFVGFGVAWLASRRSRPLRVLAGGYVEVIRNTPFLIQAFLFFYGPPHYGIRIDPVTTGVICLVIYGAAYFAEAARAAYNAIPHGQFDAADALALGVVPRFRFVVLPQMWTYLLPQISNIAIFLLKESAILSVITVPEITYVAQVAVSRTFSPVEFYLAIALMYWAIAALISKAIGHAEARAGSHLS